MAVRQIERTRSGYGPPHDRFSEGIHHVRDDLGGPIGWDLAFLALGAVLNAGGLALARSGERVAAR